MRSKGRVVVRGAAQPRASNQSPSALPRYRDAFETAGGCRFVAVSRRL
ncbi:MAG: hypothetical protein LBD24_03020 [Spirochaetaceae bacterium]|nr:hypothetical protein [Spirochaetaceae bacterium]